MSDRQQQQQQSQRSSHEASSTGATNSAPRSWLTASQTDQQAPSTRSSPRFYVPSVLLPPEAAQAPAAHKIYILGDDERSRFIAHALSGVYDSVERIGWRKTTSPRYRHIELVRPRNHRGAPKVAPMAVTPRVLARDHDTHIDQLIMTGHGHEAVEALKSVSHRVDKDTTVCLMNDGLGVLEDVRQKIFAGTDSVPNFLLGHMSHRLAFNRRYDSVKELRSGVTKFSATDMARFGEIDTAEARLNLIKTLRGATDLKPSFAPFDQWLRFKLPSVIFNSVVEPVCVFLEMPYEGLLQNPAALRMLHQLLDEIILVLDNLPEIKESSVVQDFVHGNSIRRNILGQIQSKRSYPSDLRRRVENGLPTDVEYTTGFFLRQGRHLGLKLPYNTMMRDAIKARQSLAIERLNSYIPMEETSIPSASHFRYRRTPR